MLEDTLLEEPLVVQDITEDLKVKGKLDAARQFLKRTFLPSEVPQLLQSNILVHQEHFVPISCLVHRTINSFKEKYATQIIRGEVQLPNAYTLLDIGEQGPFEKTSFLISLYHQPHRK